MARRPLVSTLAVILLNLASALAMLGLLQLLLGSAAAVDRGFAGFDRDKLPLSTRIITYVVIGPLMETLIQQALVVWILLGRVRTGGVVLASALAFALFHWQSPIYMAYAAIHGVAYILLYLGWHRCSGHGAAILGTWAAHASFNALAL